MPLSTPQQIEHLHQLYCVITTLTIPCTLGRIFTWEMWLAQGWTEADLRLVVNMLKAKIKTGPKTIACLRFSNLIGNTEFFAEDLAEAKARARVPAMDKGKAQALRDTHRDTGPAQAQIKPLAALLPSQPQEHEKMAAWLRSYRESL